MEQQVLNFRVIIEPEKMGKKVVYNAYCPTLGVADYGDSVEAVLQSMKDGIALAVECLKEEENEVKGDNVNEQLITTITIPSSSSLV